MPVNMRPVQIRRVSLRAVSRWATLAVCCLGLLALATRPAIAANPPPVQIYYVPVPEDQAFAALATIFPGNATCGLTGYDEVAEPITTYNSISVLSGDTIITYDHWEDGFEIDISNPSQPTTQVWGDGNPGNGAPPGIPGDLLAANTVIVLRSDVLLASRQSTIDFDGGDRIAASRLVALTRALWATGPGTLQAGAVEVYPTDEWGTSFRAPTGIDTPAPDLFDYTSLAIMAADDNTLVDIDLDADNVVDVQVTLDEGESFLTSGLVQEGARVQASAPVQVTMITGDICDIYEARWYVLFPENQWSSRYFSPVSTSAEHGTTAFLFNPHDSALTVTRETVGGATLDVNIAAMSGISVAVPSTSGAGFVAKDGRSFLAIAAVDSTDLRNRDGDWGFAMVPERQLTAQTLIGWGVGRDPGSSVNPGENSSPVWVIPVYPDGESDPVTICADYNGDNLGPLTDANGFKYDQTVSLTETLSLDEFASAQVLDPDGDQTGMLLYVCPAAAGQPVTAKLAAAWGQNPDIASPGPPALDLGTTAPPAATFEAGKGATVLGDVDGDGRADAGDTLRYQVTIRNASRVPIADVTISDTVPLYTAYITGTTTFDSGDGGGPNPVPDAGVTPFPLDEGGISLGALATNGVMSVTFDVLIDSDLPANVDRVRNVAIVRAGDEERRPEVETPIAASSIGLVKDVDRDVVRAGTTVTYTFLVTNTGNDPLRQVLLVDDHCTVSYVSGDAGDDGVLSVGEAWDYLCSAVISRTTTNVATVTAIDSFSDTVSAVDSARVLVPRYYLPWLLGAPPEAPCPPPDGCPVGAQVKAIAVHESEELLYISTRSPDQLVLMDARTAQIQAAADIGGEPWGVAVNEQTNRVYVSRYAGGDVLVFDALTLAPLATIPVGQNPSVMAILPDLDSVFVLVHGGSKVAIIQGVSLAAKIDAGGSKPFGIAADPVFKRIFVSHRDSSSLTVLRNENGAWQAYAGPKFTDNRQVFGLAYDTLTQRLHLVYARTVEGVDRWFLNVWEPRDVGEWGNFATQEIQSGGAIASPAVGGTGLETNPATGNLFIANTGADSLSVIDGVSLGVLATVALGDDPFAVAINSLINEVYVGLRAPGRLIKLADTY